jgi:glycosyltransferase involved in cell wall biosynthesis
VKVTLLGFTLPATDMDAILETDSNMPTQTATFAWALVDALRSAGASVTLLSSAPASSYPLNPQVRFRGGRFTDKGVDGETLGFVNLVVLKHLTRFAACLTRGTRALRRWHPDVLLIHGVHSPFLLYGLIARRLLGTRTVVVLTDPPGVRTPSDGRVVGMLKRLDAVLVRRALRSVDGVIALTVPLAADYAPVTPSIVLEGILADTTTSPPATSSGQGFRAMYAGGLLASYGVERLVRAFRSVAPETARLALFGKGELRAWIDEQAAIDPRIENVQFAPRRAILEKYASADLLIQPRPTDQDFVRYSFPSKLLEYMASGTPVLSTRLSGIPATYQPHLYWIDDDSVDGVARSLATVMALPADERRAKGAGGASFVRESCSSPAQGDRIRGFLAELLKA